MCVCVYVFDTDHFVSLVYNFGLKNRGFKPLTHSVVELFPGLNLTSDGYCCIFYSSSLCSMQGVWFHGHSAVSTTP